MSDVSARCRHANCHSISFNRQRNARFKATPDLFDVWLENGVSSQVAWVGYGSQEVLLVSLICCFTSAGSDPGRG